MQHALLSELYSRTHAHSHPHSHPHPHSLTLASLTHIPSQCPAVAVSQGSLPPWLAVQMIRLLSWVIPAAPLIPSKITIEKVAGACAPQTF